MHTDTDKHLVSVLRAQEKRTVLPSGVLIDSIGPVLAHGRVKSRAIGVVC